MSGWLGLREDARRHRLATASPRSDGAGVGPRRASSPPVTLPIHDPLDPPTTLLMRRPRARLRQVSSQPVVYAGLPGAQHSFDLFHSIRFERADRWDRGLRGGCVRRTIVASRRLVTVNESVDEALYACPARRGVRLRSHAKDRDRTWGHRGHLLHRAGGGGAAHDRLLGPVFLCRRLGRTQPRGRAAGSLRAGADRGRVDRRLPMATTFEPIERAKA
jgi:hypothetical protein